MSCMMSLRNSSGFSLLELLVVVFIVGILASMFTLSVGVTSGDPPVEREVDRLEAVLQIASEEAILKGREIGIRFYRDSYEFATYFEKFIEYDDVDTDSQDGDDAKIRSEWTVLRDDDVLGPRVLPEDVVLELEIDGRSVILDRDGMEIDDKEPEKEYQPQVFIFSSGEISPFIVELRQQFQSNGAMIEVTADGKVEVDKGRE